MDGAPAPPQLMVGPLEGEETEKDGRCDVDTDMLPGREKDDENCRGVLVVGTHPLLLTSQRPHSSQEPAVGLGPTVTSSNGQCTAVNIRDNRVASTALVAGRQPQRVDQLHERLVRAQCVKKTVAEHKRERRLSPSGRIARQQARHSHSMRKPDQQGHERQVEDLISQHPNYADQSPEKRENIRSPNVIDTEHPDRNSRVDMRRFDVRKATFTENPISWPLTAPSAEQLARVGFYYMGVEDRVRCFVCGVELEEWEETGTAEPLLRHYMASPHCSFLQQDFHDHLPALQDQSSAQRSKYANTSVRLHSFAAWPYSEIVTSYQLASVGFFYTGEGARVTCFSCGLVVKEWRRGDVPLLVHCHRNPDCPFITSIIKKGASSAAPVQAPVPHLKTLTASDASRAASRPDFADPETRLKSFKKLSPAFPISRKDLAGAGLFLLRLPDVMRCHSCSAVLQGWVEGDTAVEKHRGASPNCPFLAEHFPCKLDREPSPDFDPSSLPAPQFDETELERMAREQPSASLPLQPPRSSLISSLPPPTSLPTPRSTQHPATLKMAGLSLSEHPPSPHTPHYSLPTSHTSLSDSQPPSLSHMASPALSPTEQPLSLSATLSETASQQGSSGYHSLAQSVSQSAAKPYSNSYNPYSGTGKQSSGYLSTSGGSSKQVSSGYSSGASATYATPPSGYSSGASATYATPPSGYSSGASATYATPPSGYSSGSSQNSMPPSSSSFALTEVGGKSVAVPPSYSQSRQPSTLPTLPQVCGLCSLLHSYKA